MIFVDTAFVIAWTNEDDMLHAKALELQNRFRSEEWLTTDCVLLEVGNSLARSQRQLAIETIENLLTDERTTVVGLGADLFARSFELFKNRDDKTWGLIDCVSFIVMAEFGVSSALTSDRHFVQAGFTALMLDNV
ncbi:MAG: type II toxin-antitoxin system VapC family toxin [Acidobacteria bacterium]|nr:type II toxin-antitoxin system VapC family toxin [Acidobacteriota bacterium]